MLVQEFIDGLLAYFSRETVNNAVIDGIKNYISYKHISLLELDVLYQVIQINCATFPLVKNIDKLYQENKVNIAKSDWRSRPDWPVDKIIAHCQSLSTDCKIDEVAYFYAPVYRAYNIFNDLPSEFISENKILQICQKIRTDLEAGVKWGVIDKYIRDCENTYSFMYEQQYGQPVPRWTCADVEKDFLASLNTEQNRKQKKYKEK